MPFHDWAFKWLWTNDGVGNFTASAVVFIAGGRYVWTKHVKPHLDSVKHLHARVQNLESFSETPKDPGS